MEIHNLTELIGCDAEALFLEYFECKEALLLRGDPAAIAGLLSREEIARLLDSGAFVPPRVYLVNRGESVARSFYQTPGGGLDAANFNRLMRAGASLVFNEIGSLVPRLARLQRGIERRLRADVHINAYLTSGEGGAFEAHYDGHEVLVVQVGGNKSWEMLGPTASPANSIRPPSEIASTDGLETTSVHSLSPGDLLYLPRGQWHRAAVIDPGWSLHLSITIVRKNGIDYLEWLLKKLASDDFVATDLPFLGEALREHEDALRDRLVTAIERDGLAAFLSAADGDRQPDGAVRLAEDRPPQASDVLVSTLRRPLDAAAADGAGKLRIAGRTVRLSPAMEAALRLLDGSEHGLRYDQLVERVGGEWRAEEIGDAIAKLAEQGLVSTFQPVRQ